MIVHGCKLVGIFIYIFKEEIHMAYCVIRTDLMSGTKQPADLVSLRFYDADVMSPKLRMVLLPSCRATKTASVKL